jgi:hypothetical protein
MALPVEELVDDDAGEREDDGEFEQTKGEAGDQAAASLFVAMSK